jgi:hypothetical protein
MILLTLRGRDGEALDGNEDDEEQSVDGLLREAGKAIREATGIQIPEETEADAEKLLRETGEAIKKAAGVEELTDNIDIVEDKIRGLMVIGQRDIETGMRPILNEFPPSVSPPMPAQRGRHVGTEALSTVSRQVGGGLDYLRASEELVIYDNQPPPKGEYAVQPLNVTPINYAGVTRHHLLVTQEAGKLTGFVVEDNYGGVEANLSGVQTDYPVDLTALLAQRKARTLVLRHNRNIIIKFNGAGNQPIPLYSVESPFIIDLGLNMNTLYITTTETTKVKITVW